MKRIMKYLIFLGTTALMLQGCEDPTIDNELPYYYYETIAYLPASGTQSVEFKHTPSGIKENEIIFTVARQNNAADKMEAELQKECTVVLEAAVDGIEPEYVTFRDGMTLTIPAGETAVSSAIDIDWSFATETETALECTITVTIASTNVYLSEERYQTVYEIVKSELSNIYTTEPTSGSSVEDRSNWTVQYTNDETLSSWQDTSTLNDSNDRTYAYVRNFLAIKVDMGETKTLTGLASYCRYGSSYAPSSIIVETSIDGTDWTAAGPKSTITPASYYTYASFYEPVEARYFRLQMFGSLLLSSEIYAYAE